MKDCDIVRDLLPLYAEDICSDSSKEMVSEHLKECASCQTALEAMKADIVKKETPQSAEPLKKLGKKLKKEKSRSFKRGIAIVLAVLVIVPLLLAKGIGTSMLRDRIEGDQNINTFKIVRLEPGKKGTRNFEGVKFTLPKGLKLKQSNTSTYFANDDESVSLIISDTTEMYPYAGITANYPFMTNKKITDFMKKRSLVTVPDLIYYCRTYDASELNYFTGFSKLKESLYVCLINQSALPVCDGLYWIEGLSFDCIVVNTSVNNEIDGKDRTLYMATISDGIRTWSLTLTYETNLAMANIFYNILCSVSFDY